MPRDAHQYAEGAALGHKIPANSRRWTIVWLLFAASLINYLDRSSISLALPLLSKDLGLGPESKGLLLSAFFWTYALMQIPIGWAADRVNLRWLYFAAFVLWSLGQGLTGFATSLGVLIMFRLLLGIGESIYLPGGTKIVSILFAPTERGLPCGLFDFGTRMGLVMGGLIIPWLLVRLGWRVYLSADWFCGAVVGDPLALGYKRAARPAIPASAVHPQPETGTALVTDQPKPDWYLSRFLLLRLLLVPVCHLAPGLPGDRPPLHHPARRLFLLVALFRIWSQRTFGRLDRRPLDRHRLERNPNPKGNRNHRLSQRFTAHTRIPCAKCHCRHCAHRGRLPW